MLTIKNRLNSPQTIHTTAGPVILPALGEITVDGLRPGYAEIYRASRFIEIADGDAADTDKADLIARLEAAGVDFDKRWGKARLADALAAAG